MGTRFFPFRTHADLPWSFWNVYALESCHVHGHGHIWLPPPQSQVPTITNFTVASRNSTPYQNTSSGAGAHLFRTREPGLTQVDFLTLTFGNETSL